MPKGLARLAPESLGTLNREPLRAPSQIRAVVARLLHERVVLRGGINKRNAPRTAQIVGYSGAIVSLHLNNFDPDESRQIFLNFSLDDSEYFFAANPLTRLSKQLLKIEMPVAIYRAERRHLDRNPPSSLADNQAKIQLLPPDSSAILACVVDRSLHGLGVEVREEDAQHLPQNFALTFPVGDSALERLFAQVRHAEASPTRAGWMRLGLATSRVEPGPLIQIEHREQIIDRSLLDQVRHENHTYPRSASRSLNNEWHHKQEDEDLSVPIVEYKNEKSQLIKAILDSWGDPSEATAVVIPPSWGRTKETLLPLAATIIKTFRDANCPIIVIRFDGTNRRGESHIDPECRHPGDEYLHFTFSQAVRDIEATIEFLHQHTEKRPRATILVTFSLSSVEGRRVAARNKRRCLNGWISVVGMADLQSALRTISGGVDYGYGLTRGVNFGLQELVGVVADMDVTGPDAIESEMGFLEQARLDMAAIDIPITWIHGLHDAWMDMTRIREIMSCGDTARRKLIEVPTGHQLRESREALQTFQLIAEEVSQMAIGRRLTAKLPTLRRLESRGNAERYRIPATPLDIRSFWRDYLLGRDRVLGMELLTATGAYEELMSAQIANLRLGDGDRVVDLGCGTGAFTAQLKNLRDDLFDVDVCAIDYVHETLSRIRNSSPQRRDDRNRINMTPVLADLDADENHSIPLMSGCCDAALASLFVTYLSRPECFLREVFRILRSGGRLVVSGLKKDADISKLYREGMVELQSEQTRRKLARDGVREFDSLARNFLNDASKILDFEERGRFRFWDASQLQDMVAKAGFCEVSSSLAFGEPPQAVVVSAEKP